MLSMATPGAYLAVVVGERAEPLELSSLRLDRRIKVRRPHIAGSVDGDAGGIFKPTAGEWGACICRTAGIELADAS